MNSLHNAFANYMYNIIMKEMCDYEYTYSFMHFYN